MLVQWGGIYLCYDHVKLSQRDSRTGAEGWPWCQNTELIATSPHDVQSAAVEWHVPPECRPVDGSVDEPMPGSGL